MNENVIETIAAQILKRIGTGRTDKSHPILIEASARHVHLTTDAIETLFGAGAALGKKRDLSQPGEFLAEQRVKIVTPAGELPNVAVLGPLRKNIQVELSATDCRTLRLNPPVNVSGDLRGAADCFIIGDRGVVDAKGSVIIARAHVHLRPEEAEAFGLAGVAAARVEVKSGRPLVFDNIIVRVSENYAPAVHIDFDEANACMLDANSKAFLLAGRASADASSVTAPSAPERRETSPRVYGERLITEASAREIIASLEGDTVFVGRGTIVTPSASDIFSSARKTVRRDRQGE
ncbi:MAG: phosphate propanoyltransferase [Synergistaceae bacterium]|nr:phosphate propanoyltransferase [Synergistaceae bacterium]